MSLKVKIASGRASKILAEKIAKAYNQALVNVEVCVFSDGEFQPAFCENLRGSEVFIIQSTFPPAENLLELLYLIDAARRASAHRIIAVIPYFGIARQDRKDKPRVSIGAKLIANLLTVAGADRIITMDLHADQIQGFFDVPVDNVYASRLFLPYLKQRNFDNLCLASPDTGGTRRAATYAKYLGADLAIGFKQRPRPNEIGTLQIIGDVKDKNVVIVDDIIDTAGTICKASNAIKALGAKSVRAMCVHPVLSGNAYENLESSALEELITTDTIPLKKSSDLITVLSTDKLFAKVIDGVISSNSISSLFDYDHFMDLNDISI
ncbi:MAG TPA: ribose-phosphate pyrophosphokinase [Bacteroidales bacterium]|jgi:ribose-phosphate pyrophosphokinase|nr:ribose-phosphate pyrophosphokinase [Bacteroidales bacterium]OQA85129.1 MAG: Ribose-phosphate pyrophosphokinase [Bacteroidetes bacterium ADurb.Bin234]HOS16735.1 ribose-phosphate pyrophosphokinase [Bacteroidales bacterium]